ncbi:MAG: sigma-70 family RNA polymerase sigma factor [Phycisphaerae bacterium]
MIAAKRQTFHADARWVRHTGRAGTIAPQLGFDIRSIYTGLPATQTVSLSAAGGRLPVTDSTNDITRLLRSASSGAREDMDALMVAIYDDLRRLAVSHMSSERHNHTLQPTALVHEAYFKLVGQHATDWADRLHFFSIASRIIRRILIDHARERSANKRGGSSERIPIDAVEPSFGGSNFDLLALDEALKDLAELNERQARIVELRFFGGCTLEEIAQLLDSGRRTIDRDWLAAKAWLYCRLAEQAPDTADD